MSTLPSEGLDVGVHTVTHPRLARLPGQALRRELRDSRAARKCAIVTRAYRRVGVWHSDDLPRFGLKVSLAIRRLRALAGR